MKFSDFKLDLRLISNIQNLGFENATEVQEKTIPLALDNNDLIVRSKTGSGKTFAYLLPIINKILNQKNNAIKCLILCPTRELALQIKDECEKLIKNIQEIRVVAIFGGESVAKQIKLIKDCNIVVGTTGRVIDLIERKALKLNKVESFVLDEADQMLDMGFIKDIEKIYSFIPSNCQHLMFSATFSQEIKRLAQKMFKDFQMVEIGIENKSLTEITEEFAIIKKQNKKQALLKILNDRQYFLSIVFCNTIDMTKEVCAFLKKNGIVAKALNGDMSQFERNRVLTEFKTGKIAVLVATDVASRGLDIDDVDCIFNYDIPKMIEPFLHRVGRTARAGKTGNAITFVCTEVELDLLKQIEEKTQTEFEKLDLDELNFYFYKTKKSNTNKKQFKPHKSYNKTNYKNNKKRYNKF